MVLKEGITAKRDLPIQRNTVLLSPCGDSIHPLVVIHFRRRERVTLVLP